jgi:hypothetical protein
MKQAILILIFSSLINKSFSQVDTLSINDDYINDIEFIDSTSELKTGNIIIHKDSRIEQLVKEKSKIIPPATTQQITGYRIQLFFDTEKKNVDAARTKFIEMYPEIESNVIYKAPNYFLKVGNFRTYLEAEKIKSTLDKDFPTNYILKEKINIPPLD